MRVHVDPSVIDMAVPATVALDGVAARPRSADLDAALRAAEAALRRPDPRRDAATALTRGMYRRFGVDPTRTRPSSEALLRRLRKGERLPEISTLVDVVNWCSVESQVPFGLYDRRAIGPEVVVRLGLADESYDGIRKDRVNVAGRLVVADERGAFGNPTSDSARAMVTGTTTDILVVLFFPAGTAPADADAVTAMTRERLLRHGRPGQ